MAVTHTNGQVGRQQIQMLNTILIVPLGLGTQKKVAK
jgi:hypothetical protein